MLHTAKWLTIGLGYLALCIAVVPFLPLLWAYIRITDRSAKAKLAG